MHLWFASWAHESQPHDPVPVGNWLDPVGNAGILVSDHDAYRTTVAHGVLFVDVALPGRVVGEVLHPVIAELEVQCWVGGSSNSTTRAIPAGTRQ